jgi:hypothetical protein
VIRLALVVIAACVLATSADARSGGGFGHGGGFNRSGNFGRAPGFQRGGGGSWHHSGGHGHRWHGSHGHHGFHGSERLIGGSFFYPWWYYGRIPPYPYAYCGWLPVSRLRLSAGRGLRNGARRPTTTTTMTTTGRGGDAAGPAPIELRPVQLRGVPTACPSISTAASG